MASKAYYQQSEPVRTLDALVEAERRGKAVTPVDDMDWEDIFYIHDGNQWPSDPPAFKETMREYRAELKKLAERVMEAMDVNLGLEKGAMKGAFSGDGRHEPFFGTKVSHYPPCPRPDLVTGLRAHTDAGGVILLFQDDQVGGLEVLKDGEWTDVQPISGAIVVNTGDQVEVLSNGRYRSAWHRVLPCATATAAPSPLSTTRRTRPPSRRQWPAARRTRSTCSATTWTCMPSRSSRSRSQGSKPSRRRTHLRRLKACS